MEEPLIRVEDVLNGKYRYVEGQPVRRSHVDMEREELETAWMSRAVQSNHRYDEKSFKEGAEWMQKKMIEKTCEWLKKCFYEQEHECDYGYYITLETTFDELNDVMDDFRKAMEE